LERPSSIFAFVSHIAVAVPDRSKASSDYLCDAGARQPGEHLVDGRVRGGEVIDGERGESHGRKAPFHKQAPFATRPIRHYSTITELRLTAIAGIDADDVSLEVDVATKNGESNARIRFRWYRGTSDDACPPRPRAEDRRSAIF